MSGFPPKDRERPLVPSSCPPGAIMAWCLASTLPILPFGFGHEVVTVYVMQRKMHTGERAAGSNFPSPNSFIKKPQLLLHWSSKWIKWTVSKLMQGFWYSPKILLHNGFQAVSRPWGQSSLLYPSPFKCIEFAHLYCLCFAFQAWEHFTYINPSPVLQQAAIIHGFNK